MPNPERGGFTPKEEKWFKPSPEEEEAAGEEVKQAIEAGVEEKEREELEEMQKAIDRGVAEEEKERLKKAA